MQGKGKKITMTHHYKNISSLQIPKLINFSIKKLKL